VLSLLVLTVMLAAALVAVGSVAFSTPAEARTHHHHHRYARHHVRTTVRQAEKPAEQPSFWQRITGSVAGDASRVTVARRYLGETAAQVGVRRTLWCAAFINKIEHLLGHPGTGSDAALSFERYGHRVRGPVVGAIATMARRGGGHVGIVTGVTGDGDPVLISGNSVGNRVYEGPVDGRRIRTYTVGG
jgi:uncharacterized protein (TIGR02594 family)